MEYKFLFRGKITNDPNYGNNEILGKWAYGSLVLQENIGPVIYEQSPISGRYHVYGVDEKTIGQCSGLFDTNGNLIFEGDLLKFTGQGNEYVPLFVVNYCTKSLRWQLDSLDGEYHFNILNQDFLGLFFEIEQRLIL